MTNLNVKNVLILRNLTNKKKRLKSVKRINSAKNIERKQKMNLLKICFTFLKYEHN